MSAPVIAPPSVAELVAEYRKAAVVVGRYRGRAGERDAVARRHRAGLAIGHAGHRRLATLLSAERYAQVALIAAMGSVDGQAHPEELDVAVDAYRAARARVGEYVAEAR